MAIIDIHQIPESHELTFETPTAVTHWVCEGIFDAKTAGLLAEGTVPLTFDHPLGILHRHDIQLTEAGFKVYDITVNYGIDDKEIGSYLLEVDSLGGTVHIKGGTHVASYPSGSPNHSGLIGVKGDDVEGVDIVIPAGRLIVHFSHPGTFMNEDKVRALMRLSGSVDTSGFLGWEPYEILFLGIQYKQTAQFGTLSSDQHEEVGYHFAVSENAVNFNVANITGISKKGWDVLWVKWREAVESSRASNEAEYANVVRVYKERDLKTLLGFG